jgi:hypothetical protein
MRLGSCVAEAAAASRLGIVDAYSVGRCLGLGLIGGWPTARIFHGPHPHGAFAIDRKEVG